MQGQNKKLRGEYRKIKVNNNETGRNKKNWKFYGPLNKILGNRSATQPAVVIDSLHETNDVVESCERQSEGGSAEKGTSEGDSNTGGKCEGSVAEDRGEIEQGAEKCDAKKEQGEQKEDGEVTKTNNKRKRRTREDKFERALQMVVKDLVLAQKESDMLFLNLEEKRMKIDERMIEMEDLGLREDREI